MRVELSSSGIDGLDASLGGLPMCDFDEGCAFVDEKNVRRTRSECK